MQNFVGWYRHAAQERMRGIAELFKALGEALPGFDSVSLTESGENARALKVDFRGVRDARRPDRFGFGQLSDGQRALFALYCLIFLSKGRRTSLFLDEPDNYLAFAGDSAVARRRGGTLAETRWSRRSSFRIIPSRSTTLPAQRAGGSTGTETVRYGSATHPNGR